MGGPAAAGAKLGRYQVIKHLASGGMAEVLLARATGIEGFTRHVVIKRIKPPYAEDSAFVQMFLNEARLAAQLHHHNIVQVHDIGQEGTEYFFAMEYVHGEDLRRLLTHLARAKQTVPIEHVVTIISAAAVALHHAHEQVSSDRKPLDIVHRDVTPANILVGYDGNVKVVDFGIAKAASKTNEVTQAGALKGKASYMSPEQCMGTSALDRRSDVFALGITAYELATTRRLFKADNDFLTMSQIVAGKIPLPTTHRPDMPPQLEAILMKALAIKPEDRYQTADQMREALDQFAADARLRSTTASLGAYMKAQFGEKPEPWLADTPTDDAVISIDFDGSATGMAAAKHEPSLELPDAAKLSDEAPIVRARSKAASQAPLGKKGLTAVVPAKQAPMQTRQIPEATPVQTSKPTRRDVTPVPTAPAASPRKRTKTVQIPAQNQVGGVSAAPRAVDAVPLPGVVPAADSAVPKGIDAGWDPSRPVQMPPTTPAPPAELARGSSSDEVKPAVARTVTPATVASAAAASPTVARTTTPAPAKTPDAATPPVPEISVSRTSTSLGTPVSATPAAPAATTPAVARTTTPLPLSASTTPAVARTPTPNPASSTPVVSRTATPTSSDAAKSASSSGSWSPTKLLRNNDVSSPRSPGLPSSPPVASGSSSRIPSVHDKPDDDAITTVREPSRPLNNEAAAALAVLKSTDAAKVGDNAKTDAKAGDAKTVAKAGDAKTVAKADAKDAASSDANADTTATDAKALDAKSDAASAKTVANAKADATNAKAVATNDDSKAEVLDALAKADADADANAANDGPARDSAPALPPPPVARSTRDFAAIGDPSGFGRVDRDDASAARLKAVAPTTYPKAGREWTNGGAGIGRLLSSTRNKVIAGGAALLLIVVLVFAFSGGKKAPSAKSTPQTAKSDHHDNAVKADELATPDETAKPDEAVGGDTTAGGNAINSGDTGANASGAMNGGDTTAGGNGGDMTAGGNAMNGGDTTAGNAMNSGDKGAASGVTSGDTATASGTIGATDGTQTTRPKTTKTPIAKITTKTPTRVATTTNPQTATAKTTAATSKTTAATSKTTTTAAKTAATTSKITTPAIAKTTTAKTTTATTAKTTATTSKITTPTTAKTATTAKTTTAKTTTPTTTAKIGTTAKTPTTTKTTAKTTTKTPVKTPPKKTTPKKPTWDPNALFPQ